MRRTGATTRLQATRWDPQLRVGLLHRCSTTHRRSALRRWVPQQELIFGGTEDLDSDKPLNIEKEVGLLVQRWHDQAAAAQLEFDVHIAPDVATLGAIDRTDFHRIFNNLVGNAVKFSRGGAISLGVAVSGTDVVISITDGGPGFSEAALAMLFQCRGRAENSTYEGSGLGLYISEMLVTEVGGSISVKNNPEEGACVTVRFPMSVSNAVILPRPPIGQLPDLSHLNILLAEDNVTNQVVVTQTLKSMDARVSVASDGVQALAMFGEDNFDVVLLDIEMPRMSGLEVLREIRSRDDAKTGTPLIALTAYVMQEHREQINTAGADSIIAKPIASIEALGRQILKYAPGTIAASKLVELLQKTYR